MYLTANCSHDLFEHQSNTFMQMRCMSYNSLYRFVPNGSWILIDNFLLRKIVYAYGFSKQFKCWYCYCSFRIQSYCLEEEKKTFGVHDRSNCHLSRNSSDSTSIEMQWNASDELSAWIFSHVMVICDIDFVDLANPNWGWFSKKKHRKRETERYGFHSSKPSTVPFDYIESRFCVCIFHCSM